MLRSVWLFLTRSFCCHDCRRLNDELAELTQEHIKSLRRIANTRQLYERDGDAIARRLQSLEAEVGTMRLLMSTMVSAIHKDKNKKRGKRGKG